MPNMSDTGPALGLNPSVSVMIGGRETLATKLLLMQAGVVNVSGIVLQPVIEPLLKTMFVVKSMVGGVFAVISKDDDDGRVIIKMLLLNI